MARAKGRHWVALWLVAFLVTTWLVYARQTAAIRAARELRDPHPGGGIRGARGPGFARGTRGAGADPPRSPLGGGGAGAAYRADRAAGAPRRAVRPPRHTARRDPGDLPRGHRAQRAARPDRRRRAHQSPAWLDGGCLATGAAPPVRLLRRPVQRARGAAPAECTGRASRAG